MTDPNDSIERSVSSITSTWLERAKTGDDDAWRRLLRTYSRLVCWWCAKSGVPAQDIDDIAQDVFAAVSNALPSFKHDSFRGFLWTITRNKIQDYWRKRHRQPAAKGGNSVEQVLANVDAESGEIVGSVDQATKIIFDAVVDVVKGEFSENDWQAFWQYAVDGKPVALVAETLGISRNQVYLAKSRILRTIRQHFADQASDLQT